MAAIVDLKTEIIHKYVYELRYEFGQVYWDRAGRIAKDILSEREEWDFDTIDINRCQLAHRDMNLSFNFGHAKLDLSQTQSADVETLVPVGEFGKLAEIVTSTLVNHLELEFFPRIGFRVWHLYAVADREQSQQFMRDLQLFSLDAAASGELGEVSEVSHRLVTDRQSHMLRIAVAPFEQQVQLPPSVIRAAKAKAYRQETEKQRGPGIDKRRRILIDQMKAKKTIAHYPQFGILLDLDAYVEDPPYPDDLSVSDFIAAAFDDFQHVKQTALAAASKI
ncbi:MAG: hypothetical protein R6U98_03145 [Pirellulaceae bacterium]